MLFRSNDTATTEIYTMVDTLSLHDALPITPVRDLVALARMIRLFRRIRPRIVHAHTPKGGLLGMLAAFLARVPVRVYHMRGLPMLGATGLRRLLLRATERISCLAAHRVVCVSESMRTIAVASGLCRAEKALVLARGSGQGVDAEHRFSPDRLAPDTRDRTRRRLGIPNDAPVLGFVGRLVRDKGIIELAGAWQQLRERWPDLHLLLVGPFESTDPIPPDVTRALRSDPRVRVIGEDWDTPRLYAVMDIVALPSYREGFPNVPLEAAAMGLPVVTTRVPGCVDAVEDGVTGLLVPARDVAALTETIDKYLQDGELRHRHGQVGRNRVLRDFRPESIWAGVYDLYLDLLMRRTDVPDSAPDGAAAELFPRAPW